MQAGDKQRSAAALFSLKWQEDGTVCFQANNGEQERPAGFICRRKD